jgi:hypothetical protein
MASKFRDRRYWEPRRRRIPAESTARSSMQHDAKIFQSIKPRISMLDLESSKLKRIGDVG